MTARALRVGLLLSGNLVEERVLSSSAPITFGQSLRCTLSLPAEGVPREHVLFVMDDGQLRLRVTEAFRGRIARGDQIQSELQQGSAVDGVWTLPIPRGTRGRLQLGDATILFQEIAAAPITPRPVLPASIRGTLGDRIDRRLAVIIGASVAAHLGIAAYAWLDDVDTHSMLETPVAQQYHQEVMEVTLPDEPAPPTTTDPGPGAATPVTPTQTARPIVSRPRPIPGQRTQPTVMTEDDAQRFASILTGSEIGRTGANDLNKRQPGADLNKQIDAVGDRKVVVGNEDGGFRKQPREGIGTDPNGPQIDDPTQVANQTPKRPETTPGGRIQIRPLPPEGPGTTLTVAMVLDKINGVYMSGLQRCYKKGLLEDAKLGGKISMSFTVNERGGLDDNSARGVSTDVDACISSLMSGWHFAIPRDKDGDATEQAFKLALALQPG